MSFYNILPGTSKKLALVLVIFVLMTETRTKNVILNWVLCNYYLIWFKKNEIQALINFSSKINAIKLICILKLSFNIWHTNVQASKINNSIFKTFRIVLASFQIKYKFKKAYFFSNTVLLADISIKIVLRLFFLIFSNYNWPNSVIILVNWTKGKYSA